MQTTATPLSAAAQPRATRGARRVLRWAGRIELGLVLTLAALSAIGATYQAVATERDARAYPPPAGSSTSAATDYAAAQM